QRHLDGERWLIVVRNECLIRPVYHHRIDGDHLARLVAGAQTRMPERLQRVVQSAAGVVQVLPALRHLRAEDGAELPEIEGELFDRLPGQVRLRQGIEASGLAGDSRDGISREILVSEEDRVTGAHAQTSGRADLSSVV